MKELTISLGENNEIVTISVDNENNHVGHFFWQESDEEKEDILNMSLKDFIKEYVKYFNDHKEEDV